MLLRARCVRGAPWPRLLPALRNGLGCCRKFVLGWTGSSAPEGVLGYLASQSSAVEMTLVGGQYHALFVPVGTKRYECSSKSRVFAYTGMHTMCSVRVVSCEAAYISWL